MSFIKKMYFRQIALVVAFSMLIIGSIPAKSMAYVVGAEPFMKAVTGVSRAEDMAKLQRVLESKLVAGKLQSVGLTADEVETRVDKLSDSELHQFASQLDSLYPGGDGLGIVIALLIIVILVMVVLKLADRKIVIR
ncbi:MAG: PA2779 family protein [Deltaproteobacteria bacterium]|nr:PA2779 family protein [Deltaproteobacteria bacterium]